MISEKFFFYDVKCFCFILLVDEKNLKLGVVINIDDKNMFMLDKVFKYWFVLVIEWVFDFLNVFLKLWGNLWKVLEKFLVEFCRIEEDNGWLISGYLVFENCKYVVVWLLYFYSFDIIEMCDFLLDFVYL